MSSLSPSTMLARLPALRLSRPAKITVVVSSVSIGFIILLATFFKRRRRRPFKDISPSVSPDRKVEQRHVPGHNHVRHDTARSPNGDLPYRMRSTSPSLDRYSKSLSVSTASIDTDCTMTGSMRAGELMHDLSQLNPSQLCDLGLESLHIMIKYWEEAVSNLKVDDTPDELAEGCYISTRPMRPSADIAAFSKLKEDPDISELRSQLPELLERAYRIRESFQRTLFRHVSTRAAFDSAITAIQDMDREYGTSGGRRRVESITSSSECDSFVSAIDLADLSDLEEHKDAFHHLVLYEAALLELEHGSVPCRTLRTNMVGCVSDTEFLAKLHCVRLALQQVFSDKATREWFAESGKKVISKIMVVAERDPEDFQRAFDEMIEWVQDKSRWPGMEEELKGRGVKMITFFDVVIDFIIFDAFDDLDSPPSSVTSVVQNRWLSNGFKETALSTAVWSVLKAKRRMLRCPDGFIAHFYAVSEQTSPVFAWGFLGPDCPLKKMCYFFKDQMLGFIKDIFSFDKVRFTSVEHLAEDILRLARLRYELLAERFAL